MKDCPGERRRTCPSPRLPAPRPVPTSKQTHGEGRRARERHAQVYSSSAPITLLRGGDREGCAVPGSCSHLGQVVGLSVSAFLRS